MIVFSKFFNPLLCLLTNRLQRYTQISERCYFLFEPKMISFYEKNKNDIIYLALLLASLVAGPFYRSIESTNVRKWTGTIAGLLLMIIVSGVNCIHHLTSVLLGVLVVQFINIKYCHVVSFFLLFAYLFFFRLADTFGLPPVSGQTNLIEMIIVLRVVGVAFEINGSWITISQKKRGENTVHGATKTSEEKDDDFTELINPSFVNLLHYCFNYVGLLTGPYYRYRTFDDYFSLQYRKYANCYQSTVDTLKPVPIYIALYLILSNIWPLEYVLSEDHHKRSIPYKLFYPWAVFTAFRLRIYSGMILAESVCTSAGLGAYPTQGKNRAGHGPTSGYLKLKEMSDNECKQAQYDFKTVESMDVWGCETAVTLRDSMKVWNKAVQYWVAMVVFKRFPIKPLKIHATLFVSVIWHGFHAGYFFCIYFCPFYLMAEDIYYKLFYKNAMGVKKKIIGFIMWLLRSHSESYQGTAFVLLTFDRVWTYYSSVYHYWYIIWFVFLVVGQIINLIQGKSKHQKVT